MLTNTILWYCTQGIDSPYKDSDDHVSRSVKNVAKNSKHGEHTITI